MLIKYNNNFIKEHQSVQKMDFVGSYDNIFDFLIAV